MLQCTVGVNVSTKNITPEAKAAEVLDEEGPVIVNLERVLPADLVTQYTDNLLVLHTENEFILSFLQAQHPLAMGADELRQIGTIQSKCISRLIVSPNLLPKIIEALQQNYTKYLNNYKKAEADHDS
jgi:hypothetical protein